MPEGPRLTAIMAGMQASKPRDLRLLVHMTNVILRDSIFGKTFFPQPRANGLLEGTAAELSWEFLSTACILFGKAILRPMICRWSATYGHPTHAAAVANKPMLYRMHQEPK